MQQELAERPQPANLRSLAVPSKYLQDAATPRLRLVRRYSLAVTAALKEQGTDQALSARFMVVWRRLERRRIAVGGRSTMYWERYLTGRLSG